MAYVNLISMILVVLAVAGHVHADGSGVISAFPITGAFSASHREDRDALTIMDVAGDYNRNINDQLNIEPRAVIAQEYFRTHADDVDFLVVFSTFEFDTGDALAFHIGIQNQVQGIGFEQYDGTELFGSEGRLLGYIDMAALSRYEMDPLNPDFENLLSVIGHEVLHQWSGRVRFDQGAGPEDGLLGRDNTHWSNLLDTDASVLYGHNWRDNGDGTFTSEAVRKFFSPLDLYLAGLYRVDEVPPMTLIVNPDIDSDLEPREGLSVHGETISGTVRTITIDDIIAAEGERIPGVGEARKDFRFAFILLAGPEEEIADRQITQIDATRRAFSDRFGIWTGGRATANVYPQGLPGFTQGAPDIVEGEGPRTESTSLADGFIWLRQRQEAEGYWRDKGATTLRDTAIVADVLTRFDSQFERLDEALAWLDGQEVVSTDYLARQVDLLARRGNSDKTSALLGQLSY